jgi:hypothetical protein
VTPEQLERLALAYGYSGPLDEHLPPELADLVKLLDEQTLGDSCPMERHASSSLISKPSS